MRGEIALLMRKHWGRVLAAVLVLFVAGYYFQPFSPRYEGLTLRQWIRHNANHRQLPRREAVQYFGASAVPFLVRASRPSGLFSLTIAVENVIKKHRFEQLRSDDFDRRMACADWAQMLMTMQPDFCAELLATTTDNKSALAIAKLFYGERYLSETLRALSRQNTNLTLQARAGELLQTYRDTI